MALQSERVETRFFSEDGLGLLEMARASSGELPAAVRPSRPALPMVLSRWKTMPVWRT